MEKKDLVKTGLVAGALWGITHVLGLIAADAVIKHINRKDPSSEGKKEKK